MKAEKKLNEKLDKSNKAKKEDVEVIVEMPPSISNSSSSSSIRVLEDGRGPLPALTHVVEVKFTKPGAKFTPLVQNFDFGRKDHSTGEKFTPLEKTQLHGRKFYEIGSKIHPLGAKFLLREQNSLPRSKFLTSGAKHTP